MKGYTKSKGWRFLIRSPEGSHYCNSGYEAITCQRVLLEKYGVQSRCYTRREVETHYSKKKNNADERQKA